MTVIGDLDCQAAVFVYKDDDSKDKAWEAVVGIEAGQPIRGEHHTDKDDFLAAISAWASNVDPDNAFLCIYAHMGDPGIAPVGEDDGRIITWEELETVLGDGVHLLWLIGCKSEASMGVWNTSARPVRGFLLATSESQPWRPFIQFFADEISMDHIRPYDEMPAHLLKEAPDLAKLTKYYKPSENGFDEAFQNV